MLHHGMYRLLNFHLKAQAALQKRLHRRLHDYELSTLLKDRGK